MEDKKQEIAQAFKKYIFEYGMMDTIVSDVAQEMHISKKTIYKYFPGGKGDTLDYIFTQIAQDALEEFKVHIEENHIEDPREILRNILSHIYKVATPFVFGNQAKSLEDFKIENEIITLSFKNVYKDIIIENLEKGKAMGYYEFPSAERIFHYIYRIASETMIILRENPTLHLDEEMINMISKMIRK